MKKPTKNEFKRAKGYIAILEAFCAGKTLQVKGESHWLDCETVPSFNFGEYEYRIKPEPQYRPFTAIEAFELFVLKEARVIFTCNNCSYRIVNVGKSDVTIDYGAGCTQSFVTLLTLKEFTLVDGSPCGVLVKSE